MAAKNFRVIFTESAWEDIGDVVRYWTDRDEPSVASNTRTICRLKQSAS